MTIIALPIESASITEAFTMRVMSDGGGSIPTGKTAYSFEYEYTINGQTYKTGKIARTYCTTTLSVSMINSLLTNMWLTRNVTGSWKAYVYSKGSFLYETDPVNIGFFIPDMGHTVSVTIEDANNATRALTGDASKFIVPYSEPKVTVTIGHVNEYDKSAIEEWRLNVYSATSQTEYETDGGGVPIHGETSLTFTDTFNYKTTYHVDVWYQDTRGYTGRYSYAPSSWSGDDYFVPYMEAYEGFARDGTTTTGKLRCQPKGWLQNFGAQTNTLTLGIQVKEYGEDDTQYTTVNSISIASNPSAIQEYTINFTFDKVKSYVCRWVLTDKCGSIYGNEQVITTAYPIFGISNGRMDVFGDLHVHDDLYVDSLFYKSGDTMTINQNLPIPGYVTSNTKTMRFNVTVGKSTKYVNSVAVTAMGGWIRGLNGYINGYTQYAVDFLAEPTLTVTARIVGEHSVILVVTSSATITNVDNNTPLVYAPDATLCLTLTFGGS